MNLFQFILFELLNAPTSTAATNSKQTDTMSRIEELPDDFDESIDLNKKTPAPEAPSNNGSGGGSGGLPGMPPAGDQIPFPINEERMKEMEEKDPAAPQIPPNMASVKSHTGEELWDMMNKTPLFMTDMNKALDESMST